MNYLAIVSFTSFIIYCYFGIYVLKQDIKNPGNRLVLLISISFAFWSFGYTFLYLSKTEAAAFFWYRFSSIGWLNVASFALHFGLILTQKTKILSKKWFYGILYLPGLLLTIRSMFATVVSKGFVWKNGMLLEKGDAQSIWFWLFVIHNMSYIGIFLVLALKKKKNSQSKREKKQIQIIVSTALFSTFLTYLMNVLCVVGKVEIPVLGHMGFLFWAAGLWYGMVKYQVLSISSALASDQIIFQMSDFLFLLSPENKILKVNPQVMKTLNYKENEMIGKDFSSFISEKDSVSEINQSFELFQNLTRKIEVRLLSKCGNYVPADLSVSMILDNAGDLIGISVVGHDIRDKIDLAQKNALFEQELEMAKEIQMGLIPNKYPSVKGVRFAALYQPMIQVGGDFYDFIQIEDGKSIGIFISDVSGHGVPAALITTMIKTLIENSGPSYLSPGEFLSFMNRKIAGYTGGNFLTAFYAIYHIEEKALVYSRAAHNFPYLIRDNALIELEGKGKMIGIEKERYFEDNTILLQKNDKILFYTDGLTESRNPEGVFFEEILKKNLLNMKHDNVVCFINEIYQQMISFTQTQNLEDDVCLIGFEIE